MKYKLIWLNSIYKPRHYKNLVPEYKVLCFRLESVCPMLDLRHILLWRHCSVNRCARILNLPRIWLRNIIAISKTYKKVQTEKLTWKFGNKQGQMPIRSNSRTVSSLGEPVSDWVTDQGESHSINCMVQKLVLKICIQTQLIEFFLGRLHRKIDKLMSNLYILTLISQ